MIRIKTSVYLISAVLSALTLPQAIVDDLLPNWLFCVSLIQLSGLGLLTPRS